MPSRWITGTRPPASTLSMRRGPGSPSGQTSASGSRRSGQSVRISTRSPPLSPFAPRTRATARRSLGVGDDLELDVASVPCGHHPQQAAQRVGDAPVAADDAAHIFLVDAKRQEGLVPLVLDLDPDGIGLVDER